MRKELTLTVDAWGNIIVAGPIKDGGPDETFVAKLDKDGNMLWQRGLLTTRTSSLPPPSPDIAPASDPRDSVQPHLLDDVDHYENELSGIARFKRVWRSAGAAALVAFAVAGVGVAVQHARTIPQTTLMQHNVQREARITGEIFEPTVQLEIGRVPAASLAPAGASMPLPDPAALRAETLALLNARLPTKALPHARAYVAAAPHEAMSYLFLGATLQDLGRNNEAREVYNDCVKLSTSGDASDCYALGGRR
jgi:hypothetical protein